MGVPAAVRQSISINAFTFAQQDVLTHWTWQSLQSSDYYVKRIVTWNLPLDSLALSTIYSGHLPFPCHPTPVAIFFPESPFVPQLKQPSEATAATRFMASYGGSPHWPPKVRTKTPMVLLPSSWVTEDTGQLQSSPSAFKPPPSGSDLRISSSDLVTPRKVHHQIWFGKPRPVSALRPLPTRQPQVCFHYHYLSKISCIGSTSLLLLFFWGDFRSCCLNRARINQATAIFYSSYLKYQCKLQVASCIHVLDLSIGMEKQGTNFIALDFSIYFSTILECASRKHFAARRTVDILFNGLTADICSNFVTAKNKTY